MQETIAVLPAEMAAWIEDATGATIVTAARQAGGGRNQGWIVELQRPDDVDKANERVFLRWDRSDPSATGDPWTLRREAAVYQALSTTTLPAARFVAVHPTAQAMLLTVVDGDGRYSMIRDPDQATSVAKDFIQRLAELHALDVVEIGLADTVRPIGHYVRAQLDEMDAVIAFRGGVPHAELGLALAWLRANVPDVDGRAVLVQGDTGPGNFMFDGDHVSAIVDWELAHIGDPMDDLAWVTLRSVQEPLAGLADRFAEYELASGTRIDLDRIRYYRILAEAKIMVMSHGRGGSKEIEAADSVGDPGGMLVFGQLHRRLLVETLCEAMGVEIDPSIDGDGTGDDTGDDTGEDVGGAGSAASEPAEWHALYGVVLRQLRGAVAPRITDGFAQQRLKGLARAIKYLEAVDRNGRAFAEQELVDLEGVLGHRPSSPASGRRELAEAVRDATIDAPAALAVVNRRVQRDNALLRNASGVLADRHYDPLSQFASVRD